MFRHAARSSADTLRLADHAGGRLWIDEVGCWLLWFAPTLTLGNSWPGGAYRLRWLAELRTEHALCHARNGADWVQPRGPVMQNGKPITAEQCLRSGDELLCGTDLRLRYRIPTPLSATAVLTCESGHRTADGLDGVVFVRQTCLIGPGEQNHIAARGWNDPVLLFEQQGELWCRTHPQAAAQPVVPGEVLSGENARMRFETLPDAR